MKKNDMKPNRRKFIKSLGKTSLVLGALPVLGFNSEEKIEQRILFKDQRISPNDKVRIAGIGTGIMGHNNLDTALKVPGVELVAACDLYTGRLTHVQEKYGKQIAVTRDYREILTRKDVDAVLISTSDHFHARIAAEAMKNGKHVYCEKPMVKTVDEGLPLLGQYRKSNVIFQVGSQPISGLAYAKAKELYKGGAIGNLNCIEAAYDRQSAQGAWQYTLPTDASTKTVDWDTYLSGMPAAPFDPLKFFRWRNYKEFGTGVAGDLFVHLLTAVHYILDSNGPNTIFSSGQLSYWKDGRNVPDVLAAIMEYPQSQNHPEFQLTLRVNFASGKGPTNFVRFIGDEGVMEVSGNSVTIHHSIMAEAPEIGGWDALGTYPDAMQKEIMSQYNKKYTDAQKIRPVKEPIQFVAEDQDAHLDHFVDFFDGVRNGNPVIEPPELGFRACAPCLLCNDSYFSKKVMHWDPDHMFVK